MKKLIISMLTVTLLLTAVGTTAAAPDNAVKLMINIHTG